MLADAMKRIVLAVFALLSLGSAQAAIVEVGQHANFISADFQFVSQAQREQLIPHPSSVAAPAKISVAEMQPELFGLCGIGLVGLIARRRKRLF
jgi:hypothetical protein